MKKKTIFAVSRQVARAEMRAGTWQRFGGAHGAPHRDDSGIISRRIRRSMAIGSFRRQWKQRPTG